MIFPAAFGVIYQLNGLAVIGITTPGNSTMFRNGKIGERIRQPSLIPFFLIF
jgi:hypothetical protein